MTAVFIFWAGMIPLVPLLGVQHFRRRKDHTRKIVCIILFLMQLLLSVYYILIYLKVL